MFARLWWKEARQVWPVWAFLAVLGLSGQAKIRWFFGPGGEPLAGTAMLVTVVYLFLIAASAFAGERENRTLTMLDALPVERWRLWLAKSTFALATTLGLGLILLVGTLSMGDMGFGAIARGLARGGPWLLSALGWGLLWSTVLGNALFAAVLAIVSMWPTLAILNVSDVGDSGVATQFGRADAWHLLLALATTAASALIFHLSGPPAWSPIRRTTPRRPAPAVTSEPVVATTTREPRVWPSATWRLAWQTLREVRSAAWILLAIGAIAPLLITMGSLTGGGSEIWNVSSVVVAFLTGVSAFNAESRGRMQRFLLQHGARPGVVWVVKAALWLAVATPFAWFASWVVQHDRSPTSRGFGEVDLTTLVGINALTAFATAALCGMVFRRGITAAALAFVIWLLMAIPGGALTAAGLVDASQLFWVPVALLAIGWAWSGPWMYDRPGARKWVTLGLMAVATTAGLGGAYLASRAWSLPALEPAEAERIFQYSRVAASSVPAEENAAEMYRKAWEGRREDGGDLALVRKATELPSWRWGELSRATIFTDPGMSLMWTALSRSALLKASRDARIERGDLPAAWSDILATFRLARQISGFAEGIEAFEGVRAEADAIGQAMEWAVDARQTAASLEAARKAYRALPPMPRAADAARAQALILRNTLDMPRDELIDAASRHFLDANSQPSQHFLVRVMTTPWEVARTRRGAQLLLAAMVQDAEQPAYLVHGGLNGLEIRQNGERVVIPPAELFSIEIRNPVLNTVTTHLGAFILEWNRCEAARRALDLIFRLRIWQAGHDGRLPDTLNALVSPEDPALPIDPFSPTGATFGYIPDHGRWRRSGMYGSTLTSNHESDTPSFEGEWLLYSVGPKQLDIRQQSYIPTSVDANDLIFPLKDHVKPPDPATP
ncbi:ABC transporter permease [Paludisphaera mucosa]|uniref:ABC-2 family transporter protein n=1 Tax=Paludisphaera mucosa TaxID=3030827 RepID=A0ABT6FHM4_9BACT|nr:hypothetical protein [Paludisphaera mucosa]MDG3007088.1 hypothetical protein [Paludisphaera mucosa]